MNKSVYTWASSIRLDTGWVVTDGYLCAATRTFKSVPDRGCTPNPDCEGNNNDLSPPAPKLLVALDCFLPKPNSMTQAEKKRLAAVLHATDYLFLENMALKLQVIS
jgi:hypothetical protein